MRTERYTIEVEAEHARGATKVTVAAETDSHGTQVTTSIEARSYKEALQEIPNLISLTSLPASMARFGLEFAGEDDEGHKPTGSFPLNEGTP